MSTDEYVPSEAAVKLAWADRRLFLDSMGEGDPSPDAVYNAEFDRFLARVRRDAKAEAWDEGCRAAEQFYKRTVVGMPNIDPTPAPLNPHREAGDQR